MTVVPTTVIDRGEVSANSADAALEPSAGFPESLDSVITAVTGADPTATPSGNIGTSPCDPMGDEDLRSPRLVDYPTCRMTRTLAQHSDARHVVLRSGDRITGARRRGIAAIATG